MSLEASTFETSINVVIAWHMHQPDYRNAKTGEYLKPWVYLHAIKDYIDMANILTALPGAKVVVNFSPVLLHQLADYTENIAAYFAQNHPLRDPLLDALIRSKIPRDTDYRLWLVNQCTQANEKRLIQRFAPFQKLVSIAKAAQTNPDLLHYLDEQYFFDLLTWYHLAWLGETVRDTDPTAQFLQKKQEDYLLQDRLQLLELIHTLIRRVIPAYRALAERKQIELSVSPLTHPILPLMIDMTSAREADPNMPLPSYLYPDGEARALEQIEGGIAEFKKYFGFIPAGCWPSEGGLSKQTLALLARAGFKWAASGTGVLVNSLKKSHKPSDLHHRPFKLEDYPITCFFRDDALSDNIGFNYTRWNAEDAVNDLIHHILNIRQALEAKASAIVPIILDGENCWEYYENNGYYFLNALYKKLAQHENIHLTTFSEYLNKYTVCETISTLVAGSWVYGTFSTWVGDEAKNRAWDCLCIAKQAYDKQLKNRALDPNRLAAVTRQLEICEASDWFWWYGDYNPRQAVSDFDKLYRNHLIALYELMGLEPPGYLHSPIGIGSGTPEGGGTMRRGA
jgi:alpha-amylase/alpha-mannosidase (GH57 family)